MSQLEQKQGAPGEKVSLCQFQTGLRMLPFDWAEKKSFVLLLFLLLFCPISEHLFYSHFHVFLHGR